MQKTLNSYIDHTLLRPDATEEEIQKLCEEAVQHAFASVCILPVWAPLAVALVKGHPVKVCSVVGFPLGANRSSIKADEAKELVQMGVSEIDMVICIGLLKSGDAAAVKKDIEAVVQASKPALVKVIIEACLLTEQEKKLACLLAKEAGAHFVKSSTGFSKGGATLQDIALMRLTVGSEMGVKASGGIRDRETALAMIAAGANRLGTSASLAII